MISFFRDFTAIRDVAEAANAISKDRQVAVKNWQSLNRYALKFKRAGNHARLNPRALGASLLVFVEITLNQKSASHFEQFRREVLRIPEVQECHLVSGDFDYLIKARIHEMAEYRKLLGDMLLNLPGAAQSKSYVVMEEIKETLILPTEPTP